MTDNAAEWLAECRERAPDILQRFADGIGRGEIMLSAPGCAKGCETCYRECAVRHIAADWWSREWAEAEKLDRPALHHDGIAYTDFGHA